jgi:predicted metal-dependent hydrolase
MPAKPIWLLHIPEIIAQLEAFEIPVVDRAIIERLLGLRRRRAIELMHRFGGYQTGRTFLVGRTQLIEALRGLAEGHEFLDEVRRKERLQNSIDEAHRYRAAARVKIPIKPDVMERKMPGLAGIVLEPGHLHIQFGGAEDLLAKLYELSRAAANDFDRFRESAERDRRSA